MDNVDWKFANNYHTDYSIPICNNCKHGKWLEFDDKILCLKAFGETNKRVMVSPINTCDRWEANK
jgi:hypothetical protein